MTPAEIAATENNPRVIRNKAKIQATVKNAREVQALVDSYGSIPAYLASFPDAHAASADMRRRFKFLGDTGLLRVLTSAVHEIGGYLSCAGELRDPPDGPEGPSSPISTRSSSTGSASTMPCGWLRPRKRLTVTQIIHICTADDLSGLDCTADQIGGSLAPAADQPSHPA
jgi:hypothetical protein